MKTFKRLTESSHRFLACATLPILAAGCADQGPDDLDLMEPDATALQSATAAMTASDPSSHTTNGWCLHKRRYSGTRARIYYPSSGGCSNPPHSPMVALFRGTGFDYADYNYLLKHLARNGYIAVSIDVLGANASNHGAAVDDAVDFLDAMRTNWTHGSKILVGNVGLIGHSRGGGTARALAEELDASASYWGVRGIVGLASTFSNDGIDFGATDALMVLHGTDDADQLPDKGFGLYDGSDSEGSALFNALDKSMKLFDNTVHEQFSERYSATGDTQTMTKGYVLAFMAAHLRNDYTWYDDYIRNNPQGWTAKETFGQFTDGVYRTVLDNGESGSSSTNTMGGSISPSSASAFNIDLANNATSVHETRAMRVRGSSTSGSVTWYTSGSGFNANAHVALSLRIGQVTGSAASDLTVQLRNDGAWSTEVALDDFGVVAQSMPMCDAQNASGNCGFYDFTNRTSMTTIRIPLDEFGAHGDVEAVRLRFNGDAYKYFDVDNLAFEGWTAAP